MTIEPLHVAMNYEYKEHNNTSSVNLSHVVEHIMLTGTSLIKVLYWQYGKMVTTLEILHKQST